MSTLYVIDAETANPNEGIRNVLFAAEDADVTGGFVVRVPDGLDFETAIVDGITTTNDLITEKYAATLGFYPGFANIVFDDMFDATGVNLSNTSGAVVGGRGSMKSVSDQAAEYIETNPVALGSTPSQAIITWEAFSTALTNPKDGFATRLWSEELSGDLDVEVSFNNGSTFVSSIDGALYNIDVADQGSSLILRINLGVAASGVPRGLGSWAVIF